MMDLSPLVDKVFEHARETAPNECCGLAIVFKGKLKYYKCTNNLDGDNFFIEPQDYINAEEMGEVVGVCHSHVNYPAAPSKLDEVSCNHTGVPWLIVSLLDNKHTQLAPKELVPTYTGRVWYHQVQDCYTLIYDYYKQELGITLPVNYREVEWWYKGQDLYIENFPKAGFIEVTDGSVKEHDIFLISNSAPVANHGAIYVGDNNILHHCANRLSSKDVYGGYWRKHTLKTIRHKELL